MSRAAVSKSRADKGVKPPAAHTPVVTREIVPGKFNDQDWNFMVDKDGSEEFVEDILEEIIDTVTDKIYENYKERQLLPFTVTMAKDAILQVIEWQFLSRDEGEQNVETDPGWIQDEEPDPAVTDCWAQGSMPKNLVTPRPISPVAEVLDGDVIDEGFIENEESKLQEDEEAEPAELPDKVSDTEEAPELPEAKSKEATTSSEEQKKKKKFKFKPYTGRVKAEESVSKMTESLEQTEMNLMYEAYIASQGSQGSAEKTSGLLNMPASCHSILKVQAGRPPGNKDVQYDETGNVVAVIKLNPDKLPSHRVKVSYQVVDPVVEAAQARLEAMRHGKFMSKTLRKRLELAKKQAQQAPKDDKASEALVPKDACTPLPPPLTETIELAPGVAIKEGGRVRRGPVRYVRKVDRFSESQQSLKPIATLTTGTTLEVSDLLDRHTPLLRPIRDSPPLPPIVQMPNPPNQTKITS